MAKSSTVFVCSECGATSPKWLGRCPSCQKYNTYVEEIINDGSSSSKTSGGIKTARTPQLLSQVKSENYTRIKSGIAELDTVLGGGIVPGSLVLLGGDPGIGKSTLLTEISAHLSLTHKVLYVSAEESESQVKMRCDRLKLKSGDFSLLNETCFENFEGALYNADICIIDSIQAVYTEDLSSSAGSVGQVRECASKLMKIAKSKSITFFIIGHVTKEGSLAGPKVLEHIMDTVLYFEGENTENFKILRAVKNRFGSVQEIGVFEMTDGGIFGVNNFSDLFLSDTRGNMAGSVVALTENGARCMAVEVQTLLCKTAYGLPRRMPLGIDFNKLVLLIAVLEKRCGYPFYNQDVYLNAMGGIKLNEPACDLSICASLISAHKNQPVDKFTAIFGEVGLTGEVRPVNMSEKRVNEAVKTGFKKIIIPYKNLKSVEKFKDKIKIVPVSYVNQMIKELFND